MFIGSLNGEYRITWDRFQEKANFTYEDGWNYPSIAMDLITYFKDGSFLIRDYYEGFENWVFYDMKFFNMENDQYKDCNIFLTGGSKNNWKRVKDINNKEETDNL